MFAAYHCQVFFIVAFDNLLFRPVIAVAEVPTAVTEAGFQLAFVI